MTNAELADEMNEWLHSREHPYLTIRLMTDAIAALRHPSSDKVLVPREPTDAQRHLAMMNDSPSYRTSSLVFYLTMLAAVEAEGPRKPCPLCGSIKPHSHTSGPMGMS